MKIRVVHIISGLLTGGTESTLYKLLVHMDSARFEHAVVSLADGVWPMVARIEGLGVPVYRIGFRAKAPSPVATLRLASLVRGLHPDLIQGWMYHGNVAAQMLSAVLPATIPVVWNICATQSALHHQNLTTAIAIWLGARLSSLPARIITDSVSCARVHQRDLKYTASNWEIIPNGFDLRQFQPSPAARLDVRSELFLAPDTLLVGLIGRYHPVKDHDGFLKAAALLSQRTPKAHFLLAGRGVRDNQALVNQALSLGLSRTVHFLRERGDMPRLTAALDIAVSSSYSESFPNVVGEAMCCGVPCVVTDVGDSAWLVGDTGLVVPPRDPAALAAACGDLAMQGSEARHRLGLRARQRVVDRFAIGSAAARQEEVYELVLDQKRKSHGQYAA
jgi:glycosyltransferase involved in cell wall biosynthesis